MLSISRLIVGDALSDKLLVNPVSELLVVPNPAWDF